MPVESAADLDVFFNADEFGIEAIYTPPGGGAGTPCTVIRDNPDMDASFGDGRTLRQGDQLLFRADEVPAPARLGTFKIGAEILTIQDDPQQRDADRAFWTCTVR